MPRTKQKAAPALKLLDAAASARTAAQTRRDSSFARPRARFDADPPPELIEARVDGKRVVIEAQDEVVLRCGKASITLRANGRVIIRGTYVETRAEGVNRMKGGTVQIN